MFSIIKQTKLRRISHDVQVRPQVVRKIDRKKKTMICNLISLQEQKYMGIQTKIFFQNHDETDFRQLQQDVILANIPNVEHGGNFMALDSDFSEESFHYTPLVPVSMFEGTEYCQFTRQAGEYYCFEVQLKDLGPKWFQECSAFIEQNNLKIDRSFDLEYYPADYMDKLRSGDFCFPDQTICLIFRRIG